MSFYLRKSVNVGPIRFNLSKSGIGVSGGVKGLRAGTGPRGNYVHMGLGGVYYRKTLPASRGNSAGHGQQPSRSEPVGSAIDMKEIESKDVSNMVHSSSSELLKELNEKREILRFTPGVLAASMILTGISIAAAINPILIFILVCSLGTAVYYSIRRDTLMKTTVLFYQLDPTLEQAFGNLHNSSTRLAGCAGSWHIAASGKVHDRKYHGGASSLIKRNTTTIRPASPDFLKTNIQTVAIAVGRQTLYFFPDRILIYDEGKVGAVGYDEIRVSVEPSRCIENSPPRDAQIVDYTWQYVNKKGGPDRRFSNNPRLPICLYEEIHFSSRSGLNEVIQVSRCGIGQSMAQAILKLSSYTKPRLINQQ